MRHYCVSAFIAGLNVGVLLTVIIFTLAYLTVYH